MTHEVSLFSMSEVGEKKCFRQGEGQGQWEKEEENDHADSAPGLWIPAKGSQLGQ